jgi:DNA-binding NarL/FixJ family response regulator
MLLADAEIEVAGVGEDITTRGAVDVFVTTATLSDMDAEGSGPASRAAPVLFLGEQPFDMKRFTEASLAWGILPIDASAMQLCAAVRALSAGLMVAAGSLLSASAQMPAAHGSLTEREAEILGLLAKGLANKQIALELGISEHTAKFHVSSIYTKLNVNSRTQAVREGLRSGLIVL